MRLDTELAVEDGLANGFWSVIHRCVTFLANTVVGAWSSHITSRMLLACMCTLLTVVDRLARRGTITCEPGLACALVLIRTCVLTHGVDMAQLGLRSGARIYLAAARNRTGRFTSPLVPFVAFTCEIAGSSKRAASIDMALRQSVVDR